MKPRRLIFLIVLVVSLVVNAFFLYRYFFPPIEISPYLVMEFQADDFKGMLMGDGKYVVYSHGEVLTSEELNTLSGDALHAKYLDYPVQTSDGKTVHVMFYLYGTFNDYVLIENAFKKHDSEREYIAAFVPEVIRLTTEIAINGMPSSNFATDETTSTSIAAIKQEIFRQLEPSFKANLFEPAVLTVTVSR